MSSTGTATPARPGETRPPERVLLLSESAGLAAVLGGLLDGDDRLTRVGSLREAADGGRLAGADAVVLDTPADGRATALEHLRRQYQGPLVVLVERGAEGRKLPPDQARTLLVRPFAADDLGAALGLPAAVRQRHELPRPPGTAGEATPAVAPPLPAAGSIVHATPPDGPGGPASPPPGGGSAAPGTVTFDLVAARQALQRQGGWPDVAAPAGSPWRRARHRIELLPNDLVHAWRARRWVRVAGFWAVCVAAFLVAFVLAAQDDSLGSVEVTPLPTVEVEPAAPPTTAARLPGTTAGPAVAPGGGDFRGASEGIFGSTTSAARATTTTRRPAPGGATTRPPTTRPTTSTAGEATTTTSDQVTTTDTTVAGP